MDRYTVVTVVLKRFVVMKLLCKFSRDSALLDFRHDDKERPKTHEALEDYCNYCISIHPAP